MTDFHSRPTHKIDEAYGFRIAEIEQNLLTAAKALRPEGSMASFGDVLHNGHQTWVGLHPETLNTPYGELAEMCDLLGLHAGDFVVDLGAGYGKLGLVLHEKYPGVRFLGLELVPERVEEGKRVFRKFACRFAEIQTQDLMATEFKLPLASHYFLYDFGKTEHIRVILKQLEDLADQNHRFTVMARGKGSRSIIEHEHPWLAGINEVLLRENYSIYSY